MARTPAEGLQHDIRALLHAYPKGLSIEEISTHLSISRTTTAKYLNAMEQTGQLESRPYGPAKVYTATERVPIENFVSLLPHLILVLDASFIIRQVNDALLAFFHLQKKDLIGREIRYSTLGSYVNEGRLETLNQAMQGIAQYIEEDITIDDKTTFFHVRIVPTIFEQGEKGIVLIFEDITALKETQTHLEELVEERTSELEKVNQKLCAENAKYRKVREQLKLKEHQYEQLVESSTDLILKYSSDGELIYLNSQAAKVLDIKQEDTKYFFKGTCIPENPTYHEFADSLIPSLISDSNAIIRKEIEYFRDQNLIWISWTFRSIPSQSDSSPSILCIGTDITDRISSERRLIESEHQLFDILSHLPDPTFVVNAQKQILLWNQAMEEMTGIRAEQIIGKERSLHTPSIFGYTRPILADLIFDPDNAEIQSHFENLEIDKGIITAEMSGVGKKGEEPTFWVKVTPLKDERDQIIGAIQSMRDITTMRRLEESLIQSEQHFRGIIDASKDIIIVLDELKCYSYVNSAYEKLFHQSSAALKGSSITENPLPGESDEWDRAITSLMQTRLSNRVEIPLRGNSHEIWLDCYLIPFTLGKSGKLQILLEIRDISKLKGSNSTLWEDETALQEIGRHVSQLMPTINLRSVITPLPIIIILLMAFTGNFI